jgi:hypothetical protein
MRSSRASGEAGDHDRQISEAPPVTISEQGSAESCFVRRFSRFRVSAPVVIERGLGKPCLGMTYNAAVGGCCLVVSDAIYWSLGDELRLTFEDDQQVNATICWINRTFVAVAFETIFERLVLDDGATPVVITALESRPLQESGWPSVPASKGDAVRSDQS